jgi:LmbE family N-acetylglucosaminyl deacetylase
VIVAAHPDDETLGVGGVTALHAKAGDYVTVVVVTDGGASRAGGLARAELVAQREKELAAAARILGTPNLVCLRLPEGRWVPEDAVNQLGPLLASANLIYISSCVDFHPEHVGVARVVASLVRPGQRVRVYEVGVPLTPVLVNLVADIQAVARLKACALVEFSSQRDAVRPLLRMARYRASVYNMPAVEVFWEMTAEEFAHAMLVGDWRGRRCPFRGIGPRPLADPLAAVIGLRARARLLNLHHRARG